MVVHQHHCVHLLAIDGDIIFTTKSWRVLCYVLSCTAPYGCCSHYVCFGCPCIFRQWLPSASLCQLHSLSIVGAATDHTLSLMAKHFSNVQNLRLMSCYYVTDW